MNEGFARGVGGDVVNSFKNSGTEIKGWFEGMNSKVEHTIDVCDDAIQWLKEKERKYPKLDLEMGSFYTWMKTSETFYWRFYFLMNDSTFNQIMKDLKTGNMSDLGDLTDMDITARKVATRQLDNCKNISQLIAAVEKYASRVRAVHATIKTGGRKVVGAPYQIMLLGAAELRMTVEKIVNLAI
jgi:hypothetical protein